MSRRMVLTAVALMALVNVGCGVKTYQHVEDGSKGPTSPKESGEQGARADQSPPYGNPVVADQDHRIVPYREAFTNGFTDPTMEGSGNLSAQGNDPLSRQQQNPTWDGNTAR